jgi:hypothetical protein
MIRKFNRIGITSVTELAIVSHAVPINASSTFANARLS